MIAQALRHAPLHRPIIALAALGLQQHPLAGSSPFTTSPRPFAADITRPCACIPAVACIMVFLFCSTGAAATSRYPSRRMRVCAPAWRQHLPSLCRYALHHAIHAHAIHAHSRHSCTFRHMVGGTTTRSCSRVPASMVGVTQPLSCALPRIILLIGAPVLRVLPGQPPHTIFTYTTLTCTPLSHPHVYHSSHTDGPHLRVHGHLWHCGRLLIRPRLFQDVSALMYRGVTHVPVSSWYGKGTPPSIYHWYSHHW